MNASLIRPIVILLVEDNPGDVELIREAFLEFKIANTLYCVEDGERAMAFMRGEAPYSDVPRPDLIVLDLNLPRKDGREVLAEVKADEDLKRIPVVILTSSGAEEDVLKSYNLHANCYIRKPMRLDEFIKIVGSIQDFWMSIVVLPAEGERNG